MEQSNPKRNTKGLGYGDRIREERARLRMTQAQFASLAGVSRAAQVHYELGQRVPDLNYLAALYSYADVSYIITGESTLQQCSKALDLRICEVIFAAIDAWADESNRSVNAKLRAELFLLFYQQFSATGRVEPGWIKTTLSLVK